MTKGSPHNPSAKGDAKRGQGHDDEVARYMRAEENVARIKADFMAEHCHFRARAKIGWEIDSIASVDRSFLKGDAIVSPPASSRAALVLSAVGVDWRG